jgi:signal transduction histidine kinase
MNTRVFRALHQIAITVSGVLEPLEVARLIVDHAKQLLQVDAAGLYVYDDATEDLWPMYSSDHRETTADASLPVGAGAVGQAFLTGEPVLVDDYQSWPHATNWGTTHYVCSAMAVPMSIAERNTGAVVVRSYTPRHWTDDDVQTLTLLAGQIAPALEAARTHERARAERQQAEAAIGLRDEILAGVSHDLSGPLSRIRLYAELIQGESAGVSPLASAEQLNEWSDRIVAATISMKSIIQELIDVARLQMGQALALDLRRTDLVGLARRLVGEHQAAGRLVTIRSSCDEVIGWWDEPRLSRVLGNLLDNALNYSPNGSWVDVVVETDPATEMALVQVQDRGPGIPPGDLPRVFERFYRGSNVARASAGNGLGLSVARQIVEQHGGIIGIESELGRGTMVSLRLPRTGPPDPPGK